MKNTKAHYQVRRRKSRMGSSGKEKRNEDAQAEGRFLKRELLR